MTLEELQAGICVRDISMRAYAILDSMYLDGYNTQAEFFAAIREQYPTIGEREELVRDLESEEEQAYDYYA